jgi:hypothetical protein
LRPLCRRRIFIFIKVSEPFVQRYRCTNGFFISGVSSRQWCHRPNGHSLLQNLISKKIQITGKCYHSGMDAGQIRQDRICTCPKGAGQGQPGMNPASKDGKR